MTAQTIAQATTAETHANAALVRSLRKVSRDLADLAAQAEQDAAAIADLLDAGEARNGSYTTYTDRVALTQTRVLAALSEMGLVSVGILAANADVHRHQRLTARG